MTRLQTLDFTSRNLPEAFARLKRPLFSNGLVTAAVALFGFLLLVLLLFAGAAVMGQSRTRAAAEAALGRSALLTEATKPFDAEAGYVSAQAVARGWAGDATLVQAQVTLAADELQLTAAPWSYVFYSPKRNATALLVAAPGRTDLLSTRPSSDPVPVVEPASWQMDSTEALEQFLARGGALFLDAYPEATLTLSLTAAGRPAPTWQGRLVDDSSGSVFHLNFDAATGALVLEPVR
jgi:hypothetical protein